MTAIRAGAVYGATVFLAGTVLGVLRTVFLAPRLGATAAVALEVPVMLAASWLICGAVLSRVAVPGGVRDRVLMGGTALALLWLGEWLLAALLAGPAAFFASLATPAGALGLAAQLAFAAFPLMRRRVTPS